MRDTNGAVRSRAAARKAVRLLLGIAMAAAPVAAQLGTGSIEALVQDASGSALPGVRVVITAPATGLERTVTTSSAGLATAASLAPDTYRVVAELDGFAPSPADEVTLLLGQVVRLRITLKLEVSDSVSVTGEAPVLDVYKTDVSTNIVPEQIAQLPVADRNFERLAFIAPGVQRERGTFRFIQGAPVIGSSGNASQASIFVDGVDFTDQALGLARARFSQDAIREFRVLTNTFDAEIGGSSGGALSIITRSGTNRLAGSVFGFYRADSLRSRGALEQDAPDFTRSQIGATLGGPVAVDRTHFFASLEHVDEDDFVLFRPGGAFADLAEDIENPFTQTLGLARLDHQAGPSTQAGARLVFERYREDNFRVGGVSARSNGQQLNRDNWNLTLALTRLVSDDKLLETNLQLGSRRFDEPTNSKDREEWFSGGNTLRIGNNVVGDLLGDEDFWAVRQSFGRFVSSERSTHDIKAGLSWFSLDERSRIDFFQEDLLVYASDDRSLPLLFFYGEGSSDLTLGNNILGLYVRDKWRARKNLTLNLGLRYDWEDGANNPGFVHPLVGPRRRDDDNIQPRFAFSWDVQGDGSSVVRGGIGLFVGRYLLVPIIQELQQNGVSGRIVRSNLNGRALGLPPATWLDAADPRNTGIPLAPDINLLRDSLEAPESLQASLGLTRRLGVTGLFAEAELVYAEGDKEIVYYDTNFGGNDNPIRLNPDFNQINTYTNDGESEYKALVLSLKGPVARAGHLVSASLTFAEKKNIADDFSPPIPTGFASDPADIRAEYGASRGAEDVRFVASGIFYLPWDLILAPIVEYGSGQPWSRLLGYDRNGDGRNSDRAPGVRRNAEEGPDFRSVSLRLTKAFALAEERQLDLVVEVFNLFNSTNYDVTSVDQAEFRSGPTLASPGLPFVANPGFGLYRATLSPREVQLGARLRF